MFVQYGEGTSKTKELLKAELLLKATDALAL
jgi:hypothetical protein